MIRVTIRIEGDNCSCDCDCDDVAECSFQTKGLTVRSLGEAIGFAVRGVEYGLVPMGGILDGFLDNLPECSLIESQGTAAGLAEVCEEILGKDDSA